jgi:hypothetical protein
MRRYKKEKKKLWFKWWYWNIKKRTWRYFQINEKKEILDKIKENVNNLDNKLK